MRIDSVRFLELLMVGAIILLLTVFACGGRESEQPGGAVQDFTKKPSFSPNPDLLLFAPSSSGPDADVAIISSNPRDVSGIDLLTGNFSGGLALSRIPMARVEDILEKGLQSAGASPVQLAVRGTATKDSVRCEWRGIARTPDQRADAIRYWLGLDAEDAIPSDTLVEALFAITLDTIFPHFLETAKSNFLSIARGGLSEDYMFLTCYANYTVQEYLLGAGPTSLTLAYDRMGEAHSYELYRKEHESGSFGDEAVMGEGEYEAHLDQIVREAESSLAGIISGHESVVMLAPMGAHNAIAVEAWQAVGQWDLQKDDADVVHAVRYGTPEGDSEYKQTLAMLQTALSEVKRLDFRFESFASEFQKRQ